MAAASTRIKKKAYIQKLDNILLIIGNGFDLHCGFKTKYSDYFNRDDKKNLVLKQYIEKTQDFLLNSHICFTKENPNRAEIGQSIGSIDGINVWDVSFI